MVWFTVLLLAGEAVYWVAALSGPHVCTRHEMTMVTMRVHKRVPITVKTTTWCLKMPPRCTKYKEELRDTYTLHMEPRTRWVNECCPGYYPDSFNTTCQPECPLGCVHGLCHEYQNCECNPGFMGSTCNTPCEHGFWGKGCKQVCSCVNLKSCDVATGRCRCSAGWQGDRCELPCEEGRFGEACLKFCSCEGRSTCHHVTGDCDTAPRPCPEVSESMNCSKEIQTEIIKQPHPSSTHSQVNISETTAPFLNSSRDSPISEPLVTTNDYMEQDLNENTTRKLWEHISIGNHQSNVSGIKNSTFGIRFNGSDYNLEVLTTSLDPLEENDDDLSVMVHDSANNSTRETTTENPSQERMKQTSKDLGRLLGLDHERKLFGGESHEDQLEHATHEETTSAIPDKSAAHEDKLQQEDDDYDDDSTSESSDSTDSTDEDPLLKLPDLETTESSTPILEYITGYEDHNGDASNEEKKKTSDQKKFKNMPDKERVKDAPVTKPMKKDLEWPKPLSEDVIDKDVSYKEHVENGFDQEKPRKTSKQEQGFKEPLDVGLLKVAPNQERRSSGSKSSYSDFLSSFSIAAGVSMALIMVAGFITLLARCRRVKPVPHQTPALEMATVGVRGLASHEEAGKRPVSTDDATLPAVRPLFFSPVYLPGDGSPTEGNGGLILTAVFSTPATNIQDIYRQQDLLRETLASHYDVPPPSRRPHRDSQLSHGSHLSQVEDTEHVYEELPCQQGRSASPVEDFNC